VRKLAYATTALALLIAGFYSVRVGAVAMALALALAIAPEFRQFRRIEQIITVGLVISLVVIALALPRR
jgi:DhnA family fructose-bisphosphate aldolase class Ia